MRQITSTVSKALHVVAIAILSLLALSVLAYTLASVFGVAPWLALPATFGAVAMPDFGMYLQIATAVVLTSLLFFLPMQARILALETSHRRFHISMDDVALAYHKAHTADRAGVFTASSQFDQVRERLAYLRDHPDLDKLEPGVLEVAAQMSQQARHLADVYSDEKIARAKTFLKQRQEEAEAQQDRIVEALHVCNEIRTWAQQVDIEESIVASQLAQLDEKLQAVLPDLGYALDMTVTEPAGQPGNVVTLPQSQKPAAE